MILFYDKRDGRVFAAIDGRVHDERHMRCSVNNGLEEKNIGKMIIGWEKTKMTEIVDVSCSKLVKIEKDIYKKVDTVVKEKRRIRKGHNLDKLDLLKKFEDTSPTSPLNYRVDLETGNLIEIDKTK